MRKKVEELLPEKKKQRIRASAGKVNRLREELGLEPVAPPPLPEMPKDFDPTNDVQLTEEQVKQLMKLSPREMYMWKLIGEGYPPKNANVILKAIQMKLDFNYAKPKQDQPKDRGITVVLDPLDDLEEQNADA